jgi:hypothetical protein
MGKEEGLVPAILGLIEPSIVLASRTEDANLVVMEGYLP